MQHLVTAVKGRKTRREESPSTSLKPFWSELSTGVDICAGKEESLFQLWNVTAGAGGCAVAQPGLCRASTCYLCQSENFLFLSEPLGALSALPLTLTQSPGFPEFFHVLSPPFQQPHLIICPRLHHPPPSADPPPPVLPIFAAFPFL